jgi:PAS domain S-box-containing protein
VIDRDGSAPPSRRRLEYQDTFEQIAFGVARLDGEGRIAWINEHFATMLGERPSAMMGGLARAFVFADDIEQLELDTFALRSGTAKGRGRELRLLRRDGTLAWTDVHLATLGGARAGDTEMLVFAKDISKRKRWEESLVADEMRLNSLLSLSQRADALDEASIARFALDEAVRLTQSETGYLHYVEDDQATVTLAYYDRGALEGGAVPGSSKCPLADAGLWADCIRERRPVTHNRYPSAEGARGLPAGHAPLLRHVSVPVLEGERVRMVIGVGNKRSDYGPADVRQLQLVASDTWAIVQRKRAIDQLREGEQRVRAIIDGARDAIFTTRLDGTILDVNQAAVRTYGYSRAEMIGARAAQMRAPHELETLSADWQRACVGGAVYETAHRSKSGRCFPVEISTHLASLHGEPVVVTTARDLTHQRDLERQLSQAQKLEAIGRLAAGIAHEINTPTQYVGDNLGFLADAFRSMCAVVDDILEQARVAAEHGDDRLDAIAAKVAALDVAYLAEETPRAIEEAREGVRKVAQIVAAMKDFSHPGNDAKTPVDLARALESTVTVTRNVWKRVAEVTVRVPPDLPHPPGLIAELNQVFLNLIVNAAQAIAEQPDVKAGHRGSIDISAVLGVRSDVVEIRIADSGAGIPESIRARVFDPFFTTKPVGVGTGQGLALVHHVVVDKHFGSVTFESTPGAGTTFVVELPLRPPRAAPTMLPPDSL